MVGAPQRVCCSAKSVKTITTINASVRKRKFFYKTKGFAFTAKAAKINKSIRINT
jgi:hypothetical protein